MTLERFEFLAVLQADDVFRGNRPLYRNGRLKRLSWRGDVAAVGDAHERGIDLADQGGNFGAGNGIVAHVGGDDIGSQLDITALIEILSHVGPDVSKVIAPPRRIRTGPQHAHYRGYLRILLKDSAAARGFKAINRN